MRDRARLERSRPLAAFAVFFSGLLALATPSAASAGAGTPAIPSSLRGLRLVQLDASLGVAIVRTDDRQYLTLRQGDATADKTCRVARFYADRIEWSCVESASGTPLRFWLAKGAESVERVHRQPPQGQPVYRAPVTTSPDPGSSANSIPGALK